MYVHVNHMRQCYLHAHHSDIYIYIYTHECTYDIEMNLLLCFISNRYFLNWNQLIIKWWQCLQIFILLQWHKKCLVFFMTTMHTLDLSIYLSICMFVYQSISMCSFIYPCLLISINLSYNLLTYSTMYLFKVYNVLGGRLEVSVGMYM